MKTKGIIFMALFIALTTTISAQVVKEKKQINVFHKISSSGGIDVYFTQSNNCSLEIETDARNMAKIDIMVKDGCLQLGRKRNEKFERNSTIKAYVSAPVLDAIATSGGADFHAKEISNNKNIDIASSGGADIHINRLNTPSCNLKVSGGADADIKQFEGQNLNISASGGSDADIQIGRVDNLAASASGGADIKLTGKAKLVSVRASGGSDINVKGLTYETINASKSGGGDILK
ncbi:DUF2807 domain-containing protein [Dysgonomonas sp. Marseille-P4677]|uniref:head GIN domain-containing protein n=1 Tax=Dysgonomonas sp. Marseille-P4677 TaxID=2364790 RepID=UPI0019126078|nr:head GIN domain-containing protein [Dysgonomonas sp. Marseille-P4677]MBK5722705.1 DUF2807 domain-containing protein [Dysgonomonas sp. Marseille-P4677]